MTKSIVWIDGEHSIEVEHAEGINVVQMTVNDKGIAVSGGQTVLEALQRMPGIADIPALCYHPAVKPYGSCRLCTVEVKEGAKWKFVAACLYPVREGLEIKTDTERVRKLRKGIIELLMARCPNVKRIQELAEEYGVEKPRFAMGDQDCILCGLCVRACKEIIGKSAISLVNRGIYRQVAAPFYAYEVSEEECIGCGDCVYICPTGCIEIGSDGKPILPKVKIPYPEMEALLKQEAVSGSMG
ncbi:2Fe-2S iron-sulfur cluster-binding protein [Chloroflexota bacterium]